MVVVMVVVVVVMVVVVVLVVVVVVVVLAAAPAVLVVVVVVVAYSGFLSRFITLMFRRLRCMVALRRAATSSSLGSPSTGVHGVVIRGLPVGWRVRVWVGWPVLGSPGLRRRLLSKRRGEELTPIAMSESSATPGARGKSLCLMA